MKISLQFHEQFLKCSFLAFIIAFSVLLPSKSFSQEQAQEEQQISSGSSGSGIDQPDRDNTPVVGSSPWQNSAGSTIGTNPATDNIASSSEPATRAAARPGSALRPTAGAITDGRDPPGNPDVPFDKKMNVVFLITGAVFAFWVVRKKLGVNKLKSVLKSAA